MNWKSIFCHHGGKSTEMGDGQTLAASADLKNRLSDIRDDIKLKKNSINPYKQEIWMKIIVFLISGMVSVLKKYLQSFWTKDMKEKKSPFWYQGWYQIIKKNTFNPFGQEMWMKKLHDWYDQILSIRKDPLATDLRKLFWVCAPRSLMRNKSKRTYERIGIY